MEIEEILLRVRKRDEALGGSVEPSLRKAIRELEERMEEIETLAMACDPSAVEKAFSLGMDYSKFHEGLTKLEGMGVLFKDEVSGIRNYVAGRLVRVFNALKEECRRK